MILFILSFIAGVLTVLAPCTLPLLPVIVGSSVVGEVSRKKAFVISASLGVSVILFTFILKVSSAFVSIPQEAWTIVSGAIIIIFGFISLFPEIWESLSLIGRLNVNSNRLLSFGYKKNNFLGDVIIGLSLGPVFSSCSPTYFLILATVLPKSLTLGFIYLLVYAVGLSGSLLLISLVGQRLVSRLPSISDTHGWFRRILGLVFIILGIFIIFGVDKKIETGILDKGFFDITRVEQALLTLHNGTASSTTSYVSQKMHGPKAPEIVNPSGFINTDGMPITLAQFRGKKVVLVDIWTYSCINCQRTLPYVQGWYEKYKDMGLVVIGLHTPEFAFEKVKSNVEEAAKSFGLTYPIVMDNDYSTWNAFNNQYWPRKYLINEDGEIIYDHAGEGSYEETEEVIRAALSELNSKKIDTPIAPPKNIIPVEANRVRSPEVYFGANRNEYLSNGRSGVLGEQTLVLPHILVGNRLYMDGKWYFSSEYTTSRTAGKIIFKYDAKNVYMVASGVGQGVNVTVFKDGIKQKTIFVRDSMLYSLIEGSDYGVHTLEIDSDIPGLNIFTLTFG